MDEIKWDERGLVPVVVQDWKSRDVLMVAYMDGEAFKLTLETGKAHYYSRSRKKIWFKGETSGHTQDVKSIFLDCDNDTILITVDQKVAACHTGFWSCFYRIWDGDWKVVGKKVFDDKAVYGVKRDE
jgi:phosphoribosyl-AMP cyclohydrolase